MIKQQLTQNYYTMKIKVLFFLLVFGFLFTSCDKEYRCECITTIDWGDGTVDTNTASTTFSEKNDRKAKAACEVEQTQKFFDMTQTVVCKLK